MKYSKILHKVIVIFQTLHFDLDKFETRNRYKSPRNCTWFCKAIFKTEQQKPTDIIKVKVFWESQKIWQKTLPINLTWRQKNWKMIFSKSCSLLLKIPELYFPEFAYCCIIVAFIIAFVTCFRFTIFQEMQVNKDRMWCLVQRLPVTTNRQFPVWHPFPV